MDKTEDSIYIKKIANEVATATTEALSSTLAEKIKDKIESITEISHLKGEVVYLNNLVNEITNIKFLGYPLGLVLVHKVTEKFRKVSDNGK